MAIRIPIITTFDNRGLRVAQGELRKLGSLARQGALVAAAFGAFGAITVKAFADFDGALTKSTAIMGDVNEQIKKSMADTARSVALSTTFSAEQAAEAYFFLASAGLDAKSSIAALPQVAQFAQAGMFDMARATDLLTDAQSALGLTIKNDAVANLKEMTRISDVLVRANTLANASVEQFSTALTTKAGAALKAVNKDITEGVAVLAALADQGIKGQLAGTQLSIVLRDLTTKAIKNKSAFKSLGVEVFDSTGNMNNLGDIIASLEKGLSGMSDELQKTTLLQMGFSDKSLSSLQALLGTSQAIKTYESELRSAAGFTESVANKQLDTFNSQLKLLESAFVDVGISVGQQLEPSLRQLIPALQQALPLIGEKLVEAVNAVDWDAAVKGIADFIYWFVDNIDTIGEWIRNIGIFIGVVYSLNVALQIVSASIAIWNAGLLASPITWTVMGLGLIAIGMYKVYENTKLASAETKKLYETTKAELIADPWKQAANPAKVYNGILGDIKTSTDEIVTTDTTPHVRSINQIENAWNKAKAAAEFYKITAPGAAMSEGYRPGLLPPTPPTPPTLFGTGTQTPATATKTQLELLTQNLKVEGKKATAQSTLVGAKLSEGLVNQILGGAKPLKTANQVINSITKKDGTLKVKAVNKLNKQFANTLGEQNRIAAEARAIAERDRINAAAAAEELRRAEEAALAERKRIYSSFLDSIKNTFGQIRETILNAFTLPSLGGSADAIIRNMKKLMNATRNFATNVNNLSSLGLDPELLAQVISAGPMAGGKLAQALVRGGAGAVAEISAGYREFQGLASGIATTGVQSRFMTQPQQNVYNINVSGGVGSGATIGQAIVEAIKAYERTSGAVWQGA